MDKDLRKRIRKYNKLSSDVKLGNFKTPSGYNELSVRGYESYDNYLNEKLRLVCKWLNIKYVFNDEIKDLIRSDDMSNIVIAAELIYNLRFKYKNARIN